MCVRDDDDDDNGVDEVAGEVGDEEGPDAAAGVAGKDEDGLYNMNGVPSFDNAADPTPDGRFRSDFQANCQEVLDGIAANYDMLRDNATRRNPQPSSEPNDDDDDDDDDDVVNDPPRAAASTNICVGDYVKSTVKSASSQKYGKGGKVEKISKSGRSCNVVGIFIVGEDVGEDISNESPWKNVPLSQLEKLSSRSG
jgi:hypothetical protein